MRNRLAGAFVVVASVLLSPNALPRPIDVLDYQFFVTLSEFSDTVSVEGFVNFKRRSGAPDTLSLNLVGMEIDTVGVVDWTKPDTSCERFLARTADSGGGAMCAVPIPPSPFRYDGQVLRIPIGKRPAPSPDGVLDYESVSFSYHGAPQDGLIQGKNAHGHRVVFADNWPSRARFWLPTVDHPNDKARSSFVVSVPASWKVVSNGAEAFPETRKPGRWWWMTRHPIPTYTMVIGAGDFTVSKHRPVVRGRDTIPIEVWTYPEDSAFADSVPFHRATEIVETMQRLIGPYPYENLKHVQSSTRFGGMENSSAIFYAEQPYVERKMAEGVVRHETAHQWFGDAVTERDWPDLWLSEGFATYFDGVIGAALDGDSSLARHMKKSAQDYFKSDVTDRPIVDSANAGDPMKLLNANSYPKGAWVLHMLRGLMGDSAFFRGLRTYYQTYRDSNATSQDFERVMEKAAKADYGWFFRQWLHQPGYPQLDVTWRYEEGPGRVAVGITQRQKAEWGLFRLPRVTLEFHSATGARVRRDVAVTGRTTNVRLDMSFPPTEVLVDPAGRLLLQTTVSAGGH